jgi:hypothetical protein
VAGFGEYKHMDAFADGQRGDILRCPGVYHDDVGTDAERPAATLLEMGNVRIRHEEQHVGIGLLAGWVKREAA